MTEVSSTTMCNKCNTQIDEFRGITIEDRKPCPNCGSTGRSFYVNVHDTVTAHDFIKIKHKEPGRKKPKSETFSGHDLHRDSGRWMFLERVIDRAKNWYKEIITDLKTKEVVRHVEEPLDQHIGHGSAKIKK